MLKRLFDIVVSLSLLLVLSPFFLLLAILIKLDSKGPVFFRQERVSIGGKRFKIFKFRTMTTDSESEGQLTVGKDRRITRIGKLIRDYRIDELIQLINVLLGDMSLVGPRPEVPKYIENYPDKWSQVLSVRPGITGMASILYSKKEAEILAKAENPEKTYIEKVLPKKLGYELFYVKRQSFKLDLPILWWTVKYFLGHAR